MSKPSFDPNQPFTSAKPEFDPNAPFTSQENPEMGGSPPLGFVASQVADLAPWNKANKILKEDVAGGIAEGGGYLGAKAGFPKTGQALGVGVGGLVGLSPEILASYAGLKGIYGSSNPTVKGLINTPQELSPQYTEQNAAIGVTRRIPQEGGQLPKFPQPEVQGLASKAPKAMVPAEPLPGVVPTRLPGKPGDFMAYANNKLAQFGDKINPQELMDWQVKIQTDMGNGTIPKIDPSTGRITTIYQQATDLANRIKSVFNPIAESRLQGADLSPETIPTRAGLDKAYGVSSKVQNFTKKTVKYAGGIAGVAALEHYIRSKLGR